jgi:hypothetical protein
VSRSGPSAGYASCAHGRRADHPARRAQIRRYTNAGISATSFAGDHGCGGAPEVDVGRVSTGLLTSTTMPGSSRSDDCLLPASQQTCERHHPNQMIRVEHGRFTLIG